MFRRTGRGHSLENERGEVNATAGLIDKVWIPLTGTAVVGVGSEKIRGKKTL